jgi:hypothetical protein
LFARLKRVAIVFVTALRSAIVNPIPAGNAAPHSRSIDTPDAGNLE